MSGSKSSPQEAAPGKPLAAPEAVAMTVHSLPTAGAAAGGGRVLSGRLRMLLVFVACAAPVLASYFTYYVIRPDGRNNYATLIQPSRSMPDALPLKTLDGKAVAARSLRGQWLLVSVAPSACDAACERQLYAQRQLREMMGREKDRLDKVWLITDDAPLRPELLQALGQGPAFQFLRVPREAVAAWLEPEAGQALEAHLYVVDPMGEWMMRTPPALDPAKFKRDLSKLLRASGFWDLPGR